MASASIIKGYDTNHNFNLPPLLNAPPLPFDMITEILCKLPVKFLLQLRCVCKSWNSLISHPNFIKKHLQLSTTHHLNFVSYIDILSKFIVTSYPLDSFLMDKTTDEVMQLEKSRNNVDDVFFLFYFDSFIGSCNGILCMVHDYKNLIVLWNPSIRKFKELPLLKTPPGIILIKKFFGFGYDSLTDNYKVIVVFRYSIQNKSSSWVYKTEAKVHALGTNIWKNIPKFPLCGFLIARSGSYVSGTINWLAITKSNQNTCFIVSFDLRKESYQEILLPDYIRDVNVPDLVLGVLRDCLSILVDRDLWIMKEYGNKESWTKLFTISYVQDPSKHYTFTKLVYIFEDDQVLLQYKGEKKKMNLIVYDSRNDTFKFTNFKNTPEVCVESLISPCS